jgi:hypothetical protein
MLLVVFLISTMIIGQQHGGSGDTIDDDEKPSTVDSSVEIETTTSQQRLRVQPHRGIDIFCRKILNYIKFISGLAAAGTNKERPINK